MCVVVVFYSHRRGSSSHRGPARFLVDLGHISVEKKYILGKK